MDEKLAELAHDIWAHWMRYFFKKCRNVRIQPCTTDDPTWFSTRCEFDGQDAARWMNQMTTPFNRLSDHEKKSDYKVAKKYIEPVIHSIVNEHLQEIFENMKVYDEHGNEIEMIKRRSL